MISEMHFFQALASVSYACVNSLNAKVANQLTGFYMVATVTFNELI